MYAWRRPLWPITLAILVADIVLWLDINGVTGGNLACGNVALVVTIAWLVLGQFIGPKPQARRVANQTPESLSVRKASHAPRVRNALVCRDGPDHLGVELFRLSGACSGVLPGRRRHPGPR